jgi:hypothetical protein
MRTWSSLVPLIAMVVDISFPDFFVRSNTEINSERELKGGTTAVLDGMPRAPLLRYGYYP